MDQTPEDRYGAVERAYGQGDFDAALAQALALQPLIAPGRADLLEIGRAHV